MSKFIKCSSKDRTTLSDSSQDFKVETIQHMRGWWFRLSYAYIPISWHIVNNTNNKIYFEETEGVTLTATIANGNYNSSTLPLAIKTALQATGGFNNHL